MKKLVIAAVSAVALMFGATANAGAQDQNIVEIAQGDENFSTLVTAVSEAGLVDTLSGDGPFTVFAPTNAAFEKLPAGTLDSLLADPSGALTDVLQLHVISGEVDSAAAIAAAGTNVDTLGGPVAVELRGEDLYVGGAKVVTADIQASNGVVHVIDSVITEPASAAPAEAPTEVHSGDSGLAASSNSNGLLFAIVAGLGVVGVTSSSLMLARARRQD
jgi:uncharacterized surface protein with fasciclin (FAS1) repeats